MYWQAVYPNVSGTIGHVSRITAEWVNFIIANKARLIFFLQENMFIFLKTDKINPIPKDRQNHSYKYIHIFKICINIHYISFKV